MTSQLRRSLMHGIFIAAATGIFSAYLCFAAPTIFETVDYIHMWKPIWHFLDDSIRHGTLPFWNPYIGLGRPFLADIQIALFYLPTYLICLGPQLGVFLLIWLHCVIAVYGMRRLAESLNIGAAQGNFIALCFVGSGALTARWMTGQIPYCWSLCYTPWLFHFAVRSIEAWNIRRVALYALTLALQFLCGNPHVFWITTVGQAVFIVGRSIKAPAREALADLWRSGGQFAAAIVWCIGLVAMELLPFAELVTQGNRNAPSRQFANFMKLEWHDFGNFFTPMGLFTTTTFLNWEMNMFIGWLVFILGVVGLCRWRERNVRGLLAVLVVGFLIALGQNTPAFEIFYRWLPGFASLRIHSRASFLAVFALICAAGICLSRSYPKLEDYWKSKFTLSVRCLFIALLVFQTFDLFHATRQIKGTYMFVNLYHYRPDFPLEGALVKELKSIHLLEPNEPPPRVSFPPQLIPANDAMIHRYANFDADFSLFLRRDWDYLHRVVGLKPSEFLNTFISDEVYKRGPFPYPDLAISAGFDEATGVLAVATNTSPRAFLVYGAEVVGDYDAILARLATNHNIQKFALLEKPLSTPLPTDKALGATLAHIRRFETDSILVDVDAKANALLVLAEAWYPGWRAEIDGQTVDCIPANVWMRAVPVPAGQHHIHLYFHQNYLFSGLLISCGSTCLLLFVLAWPKLFGGAVFRRASL